MVVQSLSHMYFLIKTLRNTETSAFKIVHMDVVLFGVKLEKRQLNCLI